MIKAMLKVIIRKYWKILLGMTLICALGFATMAGLTSTNRSLQSTLRDYLRVYGEEDRLKFNFREGTKPGSPLEEEAKARHTAADSVLVEYRCVSSPDPAAAFRR